MTTPTESERLAELLREAETAQSRQQPERAAQLLIEARRLAPDHPRVLNAAGRQMLLFGSATAAIELFERALEHERDNPAIWINLASALRREGRLDKEEHALDEALKRQPRNLLALLQKGSLFELKGKRRAAARVFLGALQTIPPQAQVAEFLRPAIEHARQVVADTDAALTRHLDDRLAGARKQIPGSRTARFDHSIDAFLGRRRIYASEPTFLQVPKIAAHEFHDREDFPWLPQLEAATDAICAELQAVLASHTTALTPYIRHPESSPLDQWRELNHSRRWSAYFLWQDGNPVDTHLQQCPVTRSVLEQVPMLDVPGYAPTAFFSILDAKTHIPPHTGVTNARLIVHLPLVIPPGCGFRVGSQTREWVPGQAWVFDDTLEHEAWNDSDAPRAILIFDIWNPALTPDEQALYRTAIPAIKEFYGDEFEATTR